MVNSTEVYSNLRGKIERIPFDSALYGTWLTRAAVCTWDPAYPIENMVPYSRTINCDGSYVYKWVH